MYRRIAAVVCLIASAGTGAAKQPKPEPCPPARYVVIEGAPLVDGVVTTGADVVAIAPGEITIAGSCTAAASIKAKRKATRVRGRWESCGTLTKPKLTAKITAPACTELQGTVKVKKAKPRRFRAVLSTCGDGHFDAGGETCDAGAGCDEGEECTSACTCEPPAETGVLLEGEPDSPALQALTTRMAHPAAPANVVDGLILTRLDVYLAPDATVGQVNAALAMVEAGIMTMDPGLPSFTVVIPRPADKQAAEAVAATLEAQPGILRVLLGYEGQVTIVPDGDAANEIAHLKASRFPAAWNVSARAIDQCETRRVPVLVADHFRSDPPAGFSGQIPDYAAPFLSLTDSTHGYDVATTLGALYDSVVPTGANPFVQCLDVRFVQINGYTANRQVAQSIANELASLDKAILNASFGFRERCGEQTCDAACTPQLLDAIRAADRAIAAADYRAVLTPGADDILVTASAGNEACQTISQVYPGVGLAATNSPFTLLAGSGSGVEFASDSSLWAPRIGCDPVTGCFPSLTATVGERATFEAYLASLGQSSVTPMGNVLIVGSSDGTIAKSQFSDSGAAVLAAGEAVPALDLRFVSGTSFAAPQAAGLASYLWLLSPELRARPVADTVRAIVANRKTGFTPVDQIDAYAAVLSLDAATSLSPASTPIRLALLDVVGDGRFDENDLNLFHDQYVSPETGTVLDPAIPDFSRYDLNGNGYTGGTRKTQFDLDRVGSQQFGATDYSATVTQTIEGAPQTFDENGLTDTDILCYYAYSPLYVGDLGLRASALGILCGDAEDVFAGTVTESWTHEILSSCFEEDRDTCTEFRTETTEATITARFQRDADGQFETLDASGSRRYELHQAYRVFDSSVPGIVECTIDELMVTTGESGRFDGSQLILAGPTIYTYDRQGTPACSPISVSDEYVGEVVVGPSAQPVTVGDEVVEYRFVYDRETHDVYVDTFGDYEFVDDVYQSAGSLTPGS